MPANKIEDRQVTLGIQTANDAEVLSGLQEGEQVVVSDRSGLKAGEEVSPQVVELMQYQSQKQVAQARNRSCRASRFGIRTSSSSSAWRWW